MKDKRLYHSTMMQEERKKLGKLVTHILHDSEAFLDQDKIELMLALFERFLQDDRRQLLEELHERHSSLMQIGI